ncbi:hypothetical protein [Pseudoxanthomonas putridarboris]|uniref:Uncharacterized protein n=1 Tax=Pseudoxanthomonas putridarboris TaxID=752605 RepID=A0ABU9J1V6_9GAMM
MYRNQSRSAVITGPWQSSVAAAPRTPERRKRAPVQDPEALRAGLTPPQLITLEALEIFKWRLAFVRRPLFSTPIPVLFDRENTRYVVIEEDGTLNENPTLKLRG